MFISVRVQGFKSSVHKDSQNKNDDLIQMKKPGNTKGQSFTLPLTSCLTCLDEPVLQMKTKNVSCNTADSKHVKQEVNGTMLLPPSVFPEETKDHAVLN
jgi:hypothetical protein